MDFVKPNLSVVDDDDAKERESDGNENEHEKPEITPHFMLMQSKIYAQCEQLGYRIKRENIIFFMYIYM